MYVVGCSVLNMVNWLSVDDSGEEFDMNNMVFIPREDFDLMMQYLQMTNKWLHQVYLICAEKARLWEIEDDLDEDVY